MYQLHIISLGCPKNLVDSELMLGSLQKVGWGVVEDVNNADLLLINTCGFIQPAVEEAIDEILDLIKIKKQYPEKRLVVTGCLVQRYKKKLVEELPEVDLFIGTEGVKDIVTPINSLMDGQEAPPLQLPERFVMDSRMERRISTPSFRAWLKITEGCSNRCSYCMIPSIRGPLRSREIDDLLTETLRLESQGIKELTLIAQDLTAFGTEKGNPQLVALIKQILAETNIPWLRLLYLYPDGIEEDLLSLMAEQSRIVPYLDIPFQHVSDSVLKSMNRRYRSEDLFSLIEKIRRVVPDCALRTTFLLGFPGESDRDIELLEKFIKEAKLDHVGVFAYTNEEGSPSEHFPKQVPEAIRQERVDHILAIQAQISEQIQKKYVGNTELVLVEGLCRETDLLLEGRTRYQAPDIDGCVYITDGQASPGDIVPVRISDAKVYDLIGAIEKKES